VCSECPECAVSALSWPRSEGALGGRGEVVEDIVEAHIYVVAEGACLVCPCGTGTLSAAASGFTAAASYCALSTYRKQLNSKTQ